MVYGAKNELENDLLFSNQNLIFFCFGIVFHRVGHEEDAACHQHEVAFRVGDGTGGTDGFAHCGKGLSRHIATGSGFGKSGNRKSPRHRGLGVVICGAVVGEHTKYLHVVLIVDTAVDEMQAFVGECGEFVEHGVDAIGVVGGFADSEGSRVFPIGHGGLCRLPPGRCPVRCCLQ